jgi:hypothetical protein
VSSLEIQQRGLLALLKNRGGVPDDSYLRQLANCHELAMVRKIALWWLAFALETQCRLTARLLKRLDSFDSLVATYFDLNKTSPFIEELSLGFFSSLHAHDDPLVCAVSKFEHALLMVRAGSEQAHEILWDRHPERVILALETGDELPKHEERCVYRMRVAKDLPNLTVCARESILSVVRN